jgi:hypothetical protein
MAIDTRLHLLTSNSRDLSVDSPSYLGMGTLSRYKIVPANPLTYHCATQNIEHLSATFTILWPASPIYHVAGGIGPGSGSGSGSGVGSGSGSGSFESPANLAIDWEPPFSRAAFIVSIQGWERPSIFNCAAAWAAKMEEVSPWVYP